MFSLPVFCRRELRNLMQRASDPTEAQDEEDDGVPIPFFVRSGYDSSSATFVGRTMNALIHLTDPKHAIYSNHLYGWYLNSGESVCGMRTITCLRNTIGVIGLVGIDKLLCCKIRNELQRFVKFYSNIQTYSVVLEQFRDAIFPEWKHPRDGMNIYEAALRKSLKLMLPLTKSFCRIGQLQLLRRLIKTELQLAVDDKGATSPHELTNPLEDVFLHTDSLEGLSSLMTLYIIDIMRNMNYDSDFGAFLGKEEQSIDGWAVVAGISTVLKQFNFSYTSGLYALIGQYLLCSMESHLENARVEDLPRISRETQNIVVFMRQISSISNIDGAMQFECIPRYLVEMIEAQK